MNRVQGALLLLLGAGRLAQAQAPDYGRQLAAVHSVSSAQALLDTVTHHGITLDSLATWQQQRCFIYQAHSDSIDQDDYDPCSRYRIGRSDAWRKADFDRDGRPDLFVADNIGRAYCLLNRGQQAPALLSLTLRRSPKACQRYSVVRLRNGRLAVVHFHIEYRSISHRRYQPEPLIWQDTLVYHAGAFVEYNAHPVLRQLTRLRLSLSASPDFSGHLFRELQADLRSGLVEGNLGPDGSPGTARISYQLPPPQLDTLRRQVAYLDLVHRPVGYGLHAFDATTAILTLYYPGRPTREIWDYGLCGTYGLRKIYDILLDAREQAVARYKPAPTQLPPAQRSKRR